jgi:hypothetical protein
MKKRWGLCVLSSLFQLYKYMHLGGHFYWWRKPEYPEKSIDGVFTSVDIHSHDGVDVSFIATCI